MKKLILKHAEIKQAKGFIASLLDGSSSQEQFINTVKRNTAEMAKEFYLHIGEIFSLMGFNNVNVTRDGDVNCRFDATIIDDLNSIPIEIKSPKEDKEINIKAITQACENKIILLSRAFYPTQTETTSLAVAFSYPPSRSGVYELIEDFKSVYDINIGIIDIEDLSRLVYDINRCGYKLNEEYFLYFNGKLNYEKAILK